MKPSAVVFLFMIPLVLLPAPVATRAAPPPSACFEASASSSALPIANLLVDARFDYVVVTYANSLRVRAREDLVPIGSALGLIGTGAGAAGPMSMDDLSEAVYIATENGRVQRVNPLNQHVEWTKNLQRGACTGSDGLSADPVVHLRRHSSAAFKAALDLDVVYIATRYGCSTFTDNRIIALDAADGSVLYQINGAQTHEIDATYGAPVLDVANDILYVATDRRESTTQHSVWAFDVLLGTVLWSASKGQIYSPPMLRNGRLFVVSLYGDVHALDAATGGDLWTLPTSNPVFAAAVAPASPGPHDDLILFVDFFGNLTAVRDLGASATVAWSTALPTVAGTNKNTIALDQSGTFAYVAGSAASLYKVDLATGSLVDTLPVSSATGPVSNVVHYSLLGDPGEFLMATADTGSGQVTARICDVGSVSAVPALPEAGQAALVVALAGLGAVVASRRSAKARASS